MPGERGKKKILICTNSSDRVSFIKKIHTNSHTSDQCMSEDSPVELAFALCCWGHGHVGWFGSSQVEKRRNLQPANQRMLWTSTFHLRLGFWNLLITHPVTALSILKLCSHITSLKSVLSCLSQCVFRVILVLYTLLPFRGFVGIITAQDTELAQAWTPRKLGWFGRQDNCAVNWSRLLPLFIYAHVEGGIGVDGDWSIGHLGLGCARQRVHALLTQHLLQTWRTVSRRCTFTSWARLHRRNGQFPPDWHFRHRFRCRLLSRDRAWEKNKNK